jgi:hypothetical protein
MNILRRSLYLFVFALVAFGFPVVSTTAPFTECPAIGSDTSCAILVVINPGGTVTVSQDVSQGPYDGSEDTLVGVYNNSGVSIPGVNLSSTTLPIFGFDGDGICTFAPFTGSSYCSGAYYQTDPGDYAGPVNTFSNISGNMQSGTIVFTGGLANGASTYFSLEDPITAGSLTGSTGSATTTPAPTSIILVVTGLAAAVLYHTLRNSKASAAVQ